MPRRANPRIRGGLLAAARGLFLEKGYAATGVEEICARAGVTKGALFHHWGDKAELASEVLAEWTRAGFQAYSKAPFWKEPRAVDRLFGYVDFTIELSRQAPIGCLVGTFAQEAAGSDSHLRGLCARAFQDWATGFAALLDDAQREAGLVSRFDGKSMADHFVAVFEGAQVLAKARRSRTVVAEQLLHFRNYVHSLIGRSTARGVIAKGAGRPARPEKENVMARPPKARSLRKEARPPADRDDPSFAPVMRAFARQPGIEPAKMFGSVGLKAAGKVFAMAVKGRLVVKLPEERVEAIVASGKGVPFDPGHGKLMREWVAVEAGKASWLELAKEAHAFVTGGAR